MSAARRPWYEWALRWGQTNLTEIDPIRYDAALWREQWRRTRVQGVIVNAGGIVAYYPSRLSLQHRAEHLGERDLYGEIVAAAREDGLAVLARMDSNRADMRMYVEHPEWFAVDADGRPYRAESLYIACVNSAYYDEFLPEVLREIIERSDPDGFADNSWSGLERTRICYCVNCQRKFHAATGFALPHSHDWDSPAYKQWIAWNYARRVEIWDLNNRVTQDAGGPDCLWIGMTGGEIIAQCTRFRDYKAICERARIIMLDSQLRTPEGGFQANAEMGKLIHGLLGWDRLIPESMAMYAAGRPVFRVASKPEAEARMWVLEGFAGTIQPWWHHIGAAHEDRRQYRTAEPLFAWHADNAEFLVNRQPIASVGMVWSQQNVDFYGREAPEVRVGLPQLGMREALIRARIPFQPVHADHIEQQASDLAVLVLPDVGALSDAQCAAIRRFVERGGGLVASGQTSRYDEWGTARPDFALADLFGAHATGLHHGSSGAADPSWETWAQHSYLRFAAEQPHAIDVSFEDTDILPFGGRLEVVRVDPTARVALTFIPPFPIYPPETSWMRHPSSDLPALVLNERTGGGRVAYLAADIDRCSGRDNLPDHGSLLANVVRWAASDRIPVEVEGAGLVDCSLYRQAQRLILHIVNLQGGRQRAPLYEMLPVGPLGVRVQLPPDVTGASARLLVAGTAVAVTTEAGWACMEIVRVVDHEVVVIA